MRVILRAPVPNVGQKGDVCDVADGFARNYLVPKGLAMVAAPGAMAQAEVMRRSRQQRDARERAAAEQVASQLVATPVRIRARAGADGRLFGAVTAADVVAAVQSQTGIELDRRRLHLEPIKALGVHEVIARLHADVQFRIPVEVVAQGA